MKILNFLVSLLILLFISQSFVTACPTCWGALQLQLQQEQEDSELVGEMEVSQESLTDDDFDDEDEYDGFNDYDKEMMGEVNHEQIL